MAKGLRYEWIKEDRIAVFLDNKRVGSIRKTTGGYQYIPRGCKFLGEVYETLSKCKASLL